MSTTWKSLDDIRADYLRVTAEIEQRIADGPPPRAASAPRRPEKPAPFSQFEDFIQVCGAP
jgi:hypothetical protein